MSAPVVAVVGRPNVGKSTLLNRIVGRREAIVEERPGVTRDRKAVDAEWRGRPFIVMDTGGFIATEEGLDAEVSRQSVRAIEDADAVVMVVDVTVGVTNEDEAVAALLRGRDIPVFVVANKVDDTNRENDAWAFLALGLGDPHPISALHGRRTGDFLDVLVDALPPEGEDADGDEGEVREEILAVAIVGRPNVGKSTLFNKLDRAERSVVHDLAGTTRDTIDTVIETESGPVRILDTAGMRRRGKIDESTEYYSVVRALRAIDTADVVLLVIDALIGVTHQDQRLAERASISGSPVVVLLNKWEMADADQRELVVRAGRRPAEVPAQRQGPQDQRPHRQGHPQDHRRPAGHRRHLPPAHPDGEGQRGAPPGAGPPAGPRRHPGPLRHPGGHRPADVHPVRQPAAAAHLPALPGTEAAGGLRPWATRPSSCGSGRDVTDPTTSPSGAGSTIGASW